MVSKICTWQLSTITPYNTIVSTSFCTLFNLTSIISEHCKIELHINTAQAIVVRSFMDPWQSTYSSTHVPQLVSSLQDITVHVLQSVVMSEYQLLIVILSVLTVISSNGFIAFNSANYINTTQYKPEYYTMDIKTYILLNYGKACFTKTSEVLQQEFISRIC